MELELNKWAEPAAEARKKLLSYMGVRMGKQKTACPIGIILGPFVIFPIALIVYFVAFPQPSYKQQSGGGAALWVAIFFILIGVLTIALMLWDRDELMRVQICKTTALSKDYNYENCCYHIAVPSEAMPVDEKLNEQQGRDMKNCWSCSFASYGKIKPGDTIVLVRLFYRKAGVQDEVFPMSVLTNLSDCY